MVINSIDESHDYRVSIAWDDEVVSPNELIENRLAKWHEASIWATKKFGLPGDKYTCRMLTKTMEFWFRDEADAIIFQLRWI